MKPKNRGTDTLASVQESTMPNIQPANPEAASVPDTNEQATAPIVTPATPEAPAVTPAVLIPAVTGVPAVRSVAEAIAALPLAVLLSAMRAVKNSAGKWWYMHATDGNFGTGTPQTRYTHRVAVVSGRGDRLPDGTVAYASCVLYGLLFADNGQIEYTRSRAWHESTENPAHAFAVRVNDTHIVHGFPSTAGNSSLSLQCANTAGGKVTLYVNRGDNGAPCMEVTPKGGRYMLSAIVDENGAPV